MRVKLLNGGGYNASKGVNFPVEAKGKPYYNSDRELCGVNIDAVQLKSLGFGMYGDDDLYFSLVQGDCERLPDTTWHFATGDKDVLNSEASERRYCISERCCNQFGERDEIQTIINSLQADVVARGNRITELECEVKELQCKLNLLKEYP